MKKNGKYKAKGNGHTLLHLEFTHSTAKTVAIAGSFNNWRPDTTPMVAMGNGRWLKELVLPPGHYEYLIVADGQWLPDPAAQATVPNPYGGVNSVATLATRHAGNGPSRKPAQA